MIFEAMFETKRTFHERNHRVSRENRNENKLKYTYLKNSRLKSEELKQQRDSTKGRMLALHVINLGSIFNISYVPLAQQG